MGATRKVVLELPEEDVALLDALVASGTYPSNEASVSAALDTFRSHEDHEVDRWIAEVGAARLEEIRRDPSKLLTVEEFDREMEEHRRNRRAAIAR